MTSGLMGIGSKQDNASKNSQVYLLFAREVGPLIKAKYPSVEKIQFNQILGRIWNELPVVEKNKYYLKAGLQKEVMEVNKPGVQGVQGVVVEPRQIQMKPLEPLGQFGVPRAGDVRTLKPIFKFPSSADKDKYPTFQSYYKEIRYHLKLKYPSIDEQELVKKGFGLFKEMHKSETQDGFEEFSLETKQNLIKKYPNLNLKEIAQLVEKIWKKMSVSEREKYCGRTGGRTERTENILMREDDNTQSSPQTKGEYMEPTEELTQHETVDPKVEGRLELSDEVGDVGDEGDPLFIKCSSQTAEDPLEAPRVPAEKLTEGSLVEEEAVDDPDGQVGDEELEEGEVRGEIVAAPPPPPPVFCYCRTTVTDNLLKCETCEEFYHQECLSLSPSDLARVLSSPDWKCPECRALQAPPCPPGPVILPAVKNKVAPVKHPRIVKYQRLERTGGGGGDGGKCTTCKILVEEVRKRSMIIETLKKKIELLEGEAAPKVKVEAEASSRQLL